MAVIDPTNPVATGVVFHGPDGERIVLSALQLDDATYDNGVTHINATVISNPRRIQTLVLTRNVPDPLFHTLALIHGIKL